jgi:hypothetical protein
MSLGLRYSMICFLLLGALQHLSAQVSEVYQSRNYEMAPKDKFSIIGKVAGRTAVCLVYEEDSELVLYDSKMNEDTIIELPYLNSKHYNHKFIKSTDRLSLIFEQRKGDFLETYYVQYDQKFSIVGKPLLLNERAVNKNSEFTGYAVSDQKKCFTIYYNVVDKAKDEVTFYYTTFKITGEKLHTNKITYNITTTKPEITVLVRDNTEVSLILSLYDDQDKEISGLLYGHGTSKIESLKELQFGSGNYHRILWCLTEQLNTLSIVLQSKTFKNTGESNLFKVNLDLSTHEQRSFSKVALREEVTETSTTHDGFDDFVPQKILPLADGSSLYITEYYDFEESGSNRFFSRDMTGMNQNNLLQDVVQKKYVYGDILLMLLSPQDSIMWQRIVHKLQISNNDEGERSSFYTVKGKGNIRILFTPNAVGNDLQMVQVQPNGEVKYSLLNNLAQTNGKLLCQKSVQIAESELIVPCVGATQLSFVKVILPANK